MVEQRPVTAKVRGSSPLGVVGLIAGETPVVVCPYKHERSGTIRPLRFDVSDSMESFLDDVVLRASLRCSGCIPP